MSPRVGQLRFALLGPVRAARGELDLDLGPVRQQSVLAALALRPDVTVGRPELLYGLWGSEPPGTGSKVIPPYVHRLRRCLQASGEGTADSVIASDRSGYRFVSAGVWLDVSELAQLTADAGAAKASGDLTAAVGAWSEALALFRGEPLAGLPGPFAQGERQRLVEQRITMSQQKVECLLRLGRHAEAVGELFALTAAHPHSEALAGLLMRALYAGNRQADALAEYAQMRRRLVKDLGVEPGDELRRVQQAVLCRDDKVLLSTDASDMGGGASAAAHSQSRTQTSAGQPAADARPGRRIRRELPVDIGNLTGRGPELELLLEPADTQVVTVAAVDGMAGVGKTALVARVARLLDERYPDGCLFVDLHGHREGLDALFPQHALRRLLRAVGAEDDGESGDLDEMAASWRTATSSLRLLVLLDDASSAEQVRPLLPAGAGSLVLVTSRQRLAGLDADRRISLEPLGLDEAAGLLTRIVGGPRADLEQEAVRDLARLCNQLPLALRIIGARMQNRPKWTFEYLAARLADDERRLGELAAEDRSVEAAFRLSYEQLPEAEQRAFRALGLSPTVGLDPLALAAMLGCPEPEAERALESLVDASFVQQATADRYRLHDLVAVYARRLASASFGEVTAARTGVFHLYLAAARTASDWGPAGFPSGPKLDNVPFADWEAAATWLDAVGGELTDVVGHAAAAGYVDDACWIAEALVDYLTRQGRYHECRAAIDLVLPLVDGGTDRRMVSSLRICMGIAYGSQGLWEQARTWVQEALTISRRTGDLREQARSLGVLGTVTRPLGETDAAVAHLTEVADLARQLDDDWLAGMAACNIGAIHHQQGRPDEAFDRFAAALVIAEKIGSPRMIGKTLSFIGDLHLDLGRFAEAAEVLRQGAELAEQVVDVPLHAVCLTRLGTAEQGLGKLSAAVELHLRALAVIGDQTSAELEPEIRNRLGASYLELGDSDRAREQFELVLSLTEPGAGAQGESAERAKAVSGLSRVPRTE